MTSLTLIYHFQSSQHQERDFQSARYQTVYFFSSEGFLESGLQHEMSKTIPEADHHNLTFLSLDDLKAFALRVAEELGSKDVRLISVQDYNIALDGARDLATYQDIFTKFGELVINETVSRKKGILGKFFS